MSTTTENAIPPEHQTDYHKLLTECRSLMLSTTNSQGRAEASYAPFIRDDQGCFYVYVSELAKHTQHLRSGRTASIMLIEDERTAVQHFARRRATFQCTCETLSRESNTFEELLTRFEKEFGDIVSSLKNMIDFHLIRLTPTEGRAVLGFAKAFKITGENWEQLAPLSSGSSKGGHRSK